MDKFAEMIGLDLTPEDFVRKIDPGLLPYKEELFCMSVTSDETLKYLRPHEVHAMNIPVIYKRMLIERICNMQTPDTKKKFKAEFQGKTPVSIDSESESKSGRHPKRLFDNELPLPTDDNKTGIDDPEHKPFLVTELEKLKDERDSLNILMLHKKNELKEMRIIPQPLQPMAIPGGILLKIICDKCHRRGHKALGNRGNQACPFDQCDGYMNCGNLTKHKEYKQSIIEAEKELTTLGKDIKCNEDKITNLQTFLQQNTANFVKMVKPMLQCAFPNRYTGKDGNQALQKDLRFLKIATNGKIPANLSAMSPKDFEGLINTGRKTVSSKFTVGSTEDSVSEVRERTGVITTPPTNSYTANTFQTTQIQGNNSYYNPYPMYQMWPGMNPTGMNLTGMYPTGMYPYNYSTSQDHTGYNSYSGMWFGSPLSSVPTTCTISAPPPAPHVPVSQGQDIFPPLPLDPPVTPRPPSPE